MTSEALHQSVLDLLHKAMSVVDTEMVCGYVVLSYDDEGAQVASQVESASVIGVFTTEMEAVEAAVIHFEQVNRGVPEGSREGWLTMVKPVLRWEP